MSPFASLGRLLVLAGVVLIALGLAVTLAGRLPRLPGDIVLERPGLTVFIPLGTMVLLSLVLTIVANLVLRR
ncbi:MAG: DUF2905 domain-containing protein [Armatimonadota bacterium]|nr:DUF2905 domain-containing protein [Armatimonadota bacterium]MDR7422808.1 DUF2905 domain-containing protein [Armatimonadota bacterium]MDR7513156.1 DUF2905 domain-containing protein [Armatimonadota bacterium]